MNEEWRDVKGYEGLYQVSNLGRVKSLARSVPRGGFRTHSYSIPERIMKLQALKQYGHVFVSLCKKGKSIATYIHRLVLETFVGPCPEGMECRHFPDRNPANNRLDNLQWGTSKQNKDDRAFHGTDNAGERNGMAKLSRDAVVEIRRVIAQGMVGRQKRLPKGALQAIADKFGVTYGAIKEIRNGNNWRSVQ
jgi:hypothetical protein